MNKFDLNNRNDIISVLTQYHDWPVGNSPEFMPWDKSLNKNIGDDFILHILLTDAVNNNNDGNYPDVKYFLETPWYGFKANKKLINPDILLLSIPLS